MRATLWPAESSRLFIAHHSLYSVPLRASYDDVLVLTKPATERCEYFLLLWIDPLVGLIGWQDCEWLKVGLC